MTPLLHRDEVIAHFNRWAPNYDDSALQKSFYEPLHRLVLHEARHAAGAPSRILDVGCGTGRLLREAARTFADAQSVGVDIAQGMLACAQQAADRRPGSGLIRADVHRLPFGPGTFDLILSTVTSHHWHERRQGFAEIARVLRPDGFFILAHLLGMNRQADARRPGRARGRRDRGGVRRETRTVMSEIRAAGLVITDMTAVSTCPVVPQTLVLAARRR